jgi:hypothetical protein
LPDVECLGTKRGSMAGTEMNQSDIHDRTDVNVGREWSDAELFELGNLLMCGLSIEEIAPLLQRSHGEVQDKVVEIGRACKAD